MWRVTWSHLSDITCWFYLKQAEPIRQGVIVSLKIQIFTHYFVIVVRQGAV